MLGTVSGMGKEGMLEIDSDPSSEVTLGLVLFQVRGGGGGGVVKHLKLSALLGGTRRAHWTWQEILSSCVHCH